MSKDSYSSPSLHHMCDELEGRRNWRGRVSDQRVIANHGLPLRSLRRWPELTCTCRRVRRYNLRIRLRLRSTDRNETLRPQLPPACTRACPRDEEGRIPP